jgi:hypothetical protein
VLWPGKRGKQIENYFYRLVDPQIALSEARSGHPGAPHRAKELANHALVPARLVGASH